MQGRYYFLDGLLLIGIIAMVIVLIKYPKDFIRAPFLLVKFLVEALFRQLVLAIWFLWVPVLMIMVLFTAAPERSIKRGRFTLQPSIKKQ